VHEALALVADPDWAMRELMHRTLEQAGYSVLECASSLDLNAALRTRASRSAPCVFLVTTAAIALGSGDLLSSLGKERAATGQRVPEVLVTCEFGTLKSCPRPEFSDCVAVGILEKPFDFGMLKGIAYRCRTTPAKSAAHQVG
jgi:CheY-like chemotaxis protein